MTLSCRVLSAVWPWLLDLDVDALAVEVGLDVGEALVGRPRDRRQVVAQRRDLVGDRVGQQHVRRGRAPRRSPGRREDREAARQAQPLQAGDERVEDQRDDRRGREEQQHRARGLGDRVEREQRERQRDELDPPRHDDRGRRGGRRLRLERVVAVEVRVAPWRARLARDQVVVGDGIAHGRRRGEYGACPLRRRPSSSSATSSAASAGGRCCALLPRLRERHAPTFVVVNGENVAGGLGITPKLADELLRRRRRRHHARQPRLPPQGDLRLPRRARAHRAARELPALAARARHRASSSATASASGSSTSRATSSCARAGPRSSRSTRCWASCEGASTTSSSTCTPRPRARRSGWAGTSTAA